MPRPEMLFVDDESSLLEDLREFIAENDIAVSTAATGQEALDLLARAPGITVVLTDIRMPGFDGFALANHILRTHSEADAVEVVLMTGHGDLETAMQAVRAGVFDFFRKPMVLDEVLGVLRRAHDKAIARRTAEAARVQQIERLRADYAALQARQQSPLDAVGNAPAELGHILSHELRTPLNALLAMPDMMANQHAIPPGQLSAYLRDVHQAGERLVEIAEDLVEFLASRAKRDSGWHDVPATMLIDQLKADFTPLAAQAGVRLTCAADAAGTVQTVRLQLARALRRLFKNALAATPPGGLIDLSAQAVGPDHVAFAGRGMTAEEAERARRPFCQLDMSLTRRTGGLGLGLPLAIREAERLGGRVTIDTAPSAGTTAAILLPRRRVAA